MPKIMLDLILLFLNLGIIYALMSEGLWGAALMFFNVLFAALICFNFYEPLAALIVENASFMANLADMVAMMVLFIVPLLLLRLTTETLAPAMVRFPMAVYHPGRILFAVAGAAIVMGITMLAFEASPTQKQIVGVADYNYEPIFRERYDKDFLGFFQYTSGYTFARNGVGAPDPGREFSQQPMLFDPHGEWLIRHQEARPYGTGPILPEEPADPKPGGEAAGGAAGAGRPGAGGGPATTPP